MKQWIERHVVAIVLGGMFAALFIIIAINTTRKVTDSSISTIKAYSKTGQMMGSWSNVASNSIQKGSGNGGWVKFTDDKGQRVTMTGVSVMIEKQ